MQREMSSRHPDVKEGMIMPGPIMLNDRSGIQTNARNSSVLERKTQTNLQPQPQQHIPTFKMSDGHRDLKEGVYKPRSINNNDLSGLYEHTLHTINSNRALGFARPFARPLFARPPKLKFRWVI